MSKTIDQLWQEYETGQVKLEQYQHKKQRLENRMDNKKSVVRDNNNSVA